MTSDLDTGGESPTEFRRQRAFRIQMRVAATCFALASLALSIWGHANTPWRVPLAFLPLPIAVWMVAAIVLRVRTMDEYQRALFFPGLAVGFAVAMLAAIAIGTLSSAGLAVPNGGWIVAVAGVLSWQGTNLAVGAPTS